MVLETGNVTTVKVAVVAFAGIVMLAGTVAQDALLVDRLTTAPPAGAGAFRVTVPLDGLPPLTAVGFSVTPVSAGGTTVRTAVAFVPL